MAVYPSRRLLRGERLPGLACTPSFQFLLTTIQGISSSNCVCGTDPGGAFWRVICCGRSCSRLAQNWCRLTLLSSLRAGPTLDRDF